MRVGILTHYYHSLNYGGMLQAYALAMYLENKGYNAEQICYAFSSRPFLQKKAESKIVDSHFATDRRSAFPKRIIRSLRYRLIDKRNERYYSEYKARVIPARANRFLAFQDRVPHSNAVYSPETIKSISDQYDCLITGSDQVWNYSWFNPAFFLDIPNTAAKKISYAASAGKGTFSDEEIDYLKRTVGEYTAVSVRESDLVDVLNAILGKDTVVQTVDPTLLLDVVDWDEIASPRLVEGRYLFCYLLNNTDGLSSLARRFAKKHHLKIATIPFPGIEYNVADIRFGKYRFDDADPADFISLVKYADYIFTDSFHATVFSLIYGKQFVAFPRGDAAEMGSRLLSLTKLYECEERYCQVKEEDRADYIESLPDYVPKHGPGIEMMKRDSEAFLQRSLGD